MNKSIIRIFISHSWQYSNHYDSLSDWLVDQEWYDSDSNKTYVFIDNSVPKDDPIHDAPTSQKLKEAIDKRITASDVAIIPTGMYAEYSEWIGKEIESCKEYGVPILPVNFKGQQRTAQVVKKAADIEPVGWTSKSVAAAAIKLYESS